MKNNTWLAMAMVFTLIAGCTQVNQAKPVPKHTPERNLSVTVTDNHELEDRIADLKMQIMDINNEIEKLAFVRERLVNEIEKMSRHMDEAVEGRSRMEAEKKEQHFERLLHAKEKLQIKLKDLSIKAKEDPDLKPELEKNQKDSFVGQSCFGKRRNQAS